MRRFGQTQRLARAGIAAALLGFCFVSQVEAQEKIRIGKPEATGFIFSAADIGIEKGIFAKHALQAETIAFAGGARLHQAMAATSVDIALGAGPDMAFISKGAPEKGIAAIAGAPLSIVVLTRPDYRHQHNLRSQRTHDWRLGPPRPDLLARRRIVATQRLGR
jgi:ABC-type nitrate/sulfonate/bicarbonate transport system substrate-binding protein